MATGQSLRDRFRLKWIPIGLNAQRLEAYRRYPDMSETVVSS